MNIFEELRQVLSIQKQGELPLWLISEIEAIAADAERYAEKAELVEQLIYQMRSYDPYAGTGCFDESASAETIGNTIRKILA
jgi:hypothetical protein